MEKSPLISIITVCFNAEKTIEQTVQSVLSQSYRNVEYLVIDGGSKDNTLSILEKYQNKINKIVSEQDNGLYDAMNKGLNLATGDYVFFLNADDLFYNENVLTKIIDYCPKSMPDVYYGEVMFIDESGNEIGLRSKMTTQKTPENLTWKSLKYGMVVSHQAFLVKKEIAVLYDTKYKLCADIDWMIRCLKNAKHCCNTHLMFSKFRTGGLSKQQQKKSWKERYLILGKHYGKLTNLFRHLFIIRRYLINKRLRF